MPSAEPAYSIGHDQPMETSSSSVVTCMFNDAVLFPENSVEPTDQQIDASVNVSSNNCCIGDVDIPLESSTEPTNFGDSTGLPMENTVPVTYSIDNLDTNVKCRYTRTDGRSNQFLHYFHSLAIKDRIEEFSQAPYHGCLNNMTKTAVNLLPTLKSDDDLTDTMAMIISHVITTRMPYFKFACSDIVTWHCEHKYYEEMSTKSEMVWYGLIHAPYAIL